MSLLNLYISPSAIIMNLIGRVMTLSSVALSSDLIGEKTDGCGRSTGCRGSWDSQRPRFVPRGHQQPRALSFQPDRAGEVSIGLDVLVKLAGILDLDPATLLLMATSMQNHESFKDGQNVFRSNWQESEGQGLTLRLSRRLGLGSHVLVDQLVLRRLLTQLRLID